MLRPQERASPNSSGLFYNQCRHNPRKFQQVMQMQVDYVENGLIVNLPIHVDKQVSESGHLSEIFRKWSWDEPVTLQDAETFGIFLGHLLQFFAA
jgi:hypothetical protein